MDETNLVEELGDMCWYIAEACAALGVTIGYVMEKNILKLQERYPEKYSDEQAAEHNRDRAAERAILGELTESIEMERSIHGKRILDPGSMFVTDWVNRNTLSLFPFTIGTTAQRILPANPLRTYLIVQNRSGGTIFINFGQNPTLFSSLEIFAGGNITFEGGATGGAFSPQDDVYLLGSAAALDGVAGEGLWTPMAQVT